MRIAINTRFLLEGQLEGIGRYSYEICKRLVEQHPEDDFIFLFDRAYSEHFVFGANVTAVALPPPARHPLLWYLWFEWAIPLALRKYKADVFFSPDGYLSLRSDVPTLLCVHDIAFVHFPELISGAVSRFYRYFTPKYLKKAVKIATVSLFVKNDIKKHYRIADAKIAVTYNGVQAEFLPLSQSEKERVKADFSQGQDYFFFVGAVHPRKNVHRMIAAFDEFKRKSSSKVKLLIAGRFAWQTAEVKKAFDAATCQSDILFLGFVSENDLPRLMGAAMAFVWVSLFEGFGIPLLEAMHAEVPIITSTVSAMPEVAGDAAILVNPESISEIAKAMAAINSDMDLRCRLVSAGKLQREKFNWDSSADLVYKLLKEVAAC